MGSIWVISVIIFHLFLVSIRWVFKLQAFMLFGATILHIRGLYKMFFINRWVFQCELFPLFLNWVSQLHGVWLPNPFSMAD